MGLVEAGWLVVVFVIGLLVIHSPPLLAPGRQDPGHDSRSAENTQSEFLYIIHSSRFPYSPCLSGANFLTGQGIAVVRPGQGHFNPCPRKSPRSSRGSRPEQ